jgi:hypothetical protein
MQDNIRIFRTILRAKTRTLPEHSSVSSKKL